MCGGSLINSPAGNFTSPGYDGVSNYSRNLNCEWTLSNPSQGNSSIYIHFENFYLESHQDCQFDVLEFRVGEFNQKPLLSFIYGIFLFLETTNNERSQIIVAYLHKIQKKHCSDKAIIPFVSNRGKHALWIVREMGQHLQLDSVSLMRFTQERLWSVFALLMNSGSPFNYRLLLKTPSLGACQCCTELSGFTEQAVDHSLGPRSQKQLWNAPDREAHGTCLRNLSQSGRVCLCFHDRKGLGCT